MAYPPEFQPYRSATSAATSAAVLDAGLRAYMLRVYNWMASGLVLTGIIAYGVANTPLINLFYPLRTLGNGVEVPVPTPLAYLAIFSPLAFVLVLSLGINRLSRQMAQILYWAFAAAMGFSLTNIFLVYTATSIVEVFFITAGTFAAMSLYGYTTNADLSRFRSFLLMGLFGLIIAMLVNMFLHASGLAFAISVIGVLVFTGLTAYDTQRIKADYIAYGSQFGVEAAAMRSVYDSLALYLNFINLFMILLQLLGQTNRR